VSHPEARTCRICEGGLRFAFDAREMLLGTRESFSYLECRTCGCVQIDRIPADLASFYPATYYTKQATGGRQRRIRTASRLRSVWTRWRLARGWAGRPWAGRRYARFEWFARTGVQPDSAILDVGCGSGRLLWRLHREGFQNLTGIDPQLAAPMRLQESPRLERVTLDRHQGRYRLVMAHHSFEHLEDPRAGFRDLARLVETGGWLLLRIPLADSWARDHYAEDWVQLDAPRHLHLHTRASIAMLASAFGFRIEHVADDSGPFQIWGSELYRRDIALSEAGRGGRRLAGVWARWGARRQAKKLRQAGRGDQACFYLQRMPPGAGAVQEHALRD
jgi:SAM-dependent methyltransferase